MDIAVGKRSVWQLDSLLEGFTVNGKTYTSSTDVAQSFSWGFKEIYVDVDGTGHQPGIKINIGTLRHVDGAGNVIPYNEPSYSKGIEADGTMRYLYYYDFEVTVRTVGDSWYTLVNLPGVGNVRVWELEDEQVVVYPIIKMDLEKSIFDNEVEAYFDACTVVGVEAEVSAAGWTWEELQARYDDWIAQGNKPPWVRAMAPLNSPLNAYTVYDDDRDTKVTMGAELKTGFERTPEYFLFWETGTLTWNAFDVYVKYTVRYQVLVKDPPIVDPDPDEPMEYTRDRVILITPKPWQFPDFLGILQTILLYLGIFIGAIFGMKIILSLVRRKK